MSTNPLAQQTFESVLESFIYDRKTKGLTPRTIYEYVQEIGYFTKWIKENDHPNDIEQISPGILRKYFLHLSERGRNKGGVHCNFRVIKLFFNYYDKEFEPQWKNPFKKVKIALTHTEPLPEIEIEDIQKLIDSCKETKYSLRNSTILKCLVDCGARSSEFLKLNFEDVNLITGEVQIHYGKGGKYRSTWLGEKSRKSLRRYLKTRENLRHDSALWINDDGERLKYGGLRMIVTRLENKVGMEHRSLHSFRRAFGILLYRKGVDIFTISKLLGHSQIEVTKRYLNLSNGDLREAHNRASPADLLN
jgi:integrase/recombinase XerD